MIILIEVKISLELTKNGIQKTVFAKAGEHGARRIIINLTCNGKVLDVSDAAYDMHMLTQNGTEIDDYAEFCEKEGTGYAFSIPALTEGERIFEVAVSKGEQRLYSPRFRLYSEASYDAESWTEPGDPILYQPILANADIIEAVDMADDDYAIIYDTDLEKAVKVLWSSLQYDDSELRQSMWNVIGRLTDAESAISNRYTKSETNTLLGAKVDKETGKGLSSNDFTDEHITAITNNTAARHTHSNKTVIDKFSENAAGEPLYDGEPIGGGGTPAWSDITGKPTTLAGYGVENEVNGKVQTAIEMVELCKDPQFHETYYSPEEIQEMSGKHFLWNKNPVIGIRLSGVGSSMKAYVLYVVSSIPALTKVSLAASVIDSNKFFNPFDLSSDFSSNDFTDALKTKLDNIVFRSTVSSANLGITMADMLAGLVAYDDSETYSDGTVGKEIAELKSSVSVLPEVHIGTSAPTGEETLWVDTDEDEEPDDVATLADLATKISLPSNPQNGDVLMWNGTNWVAQKQSRLPTEYQEVEYIESTKDGGQYIDTGIVPNGTTKIILDFDFLDDFVAYSGIIGKYESGKHFGAFFGGSDGYAQYFHGKSISSSSDFVRNKSYVLIISETEISCSDAYFYYSRTSFNSNFTLRLFGYSNTETLAWRVREFIWYENELLKGHFIPCYRISDNEIGMYDLVTNTFFTNSGTGTFLKGADV